MSAGDGHSEAVRVWYDPAVLRYDDLLAAYFDGHEPRWPVRRKARSVIWHHNDEQRAAAEAALGARPGVPVDIEPVMRWHDAEEYQQMYLAKEARQAKRARDGVGGDADSDAPPAR